MRSEEFAPAITTTIETSCSDASNADTRLFRGMTMRPFMDHFIRDIRQDRKPRDSSEILRVIFDTYCSLIGVPHRKNNTLSTSTSITQAAQFGITVYRVYPFNSSLYLYSPKFRDLIDLAIRIEDDWMLQTDQQVKIENYFHQNLTSIKENYPLVCVKSLSDVNHNGEILVYGSKYVGVFIDHFQLGANR